MMRVLVRIPGADERPPRSHAHCESVGTLGVVVTTSGAGAAAANVNVPATAQQKLDAWLDHPQIMPILNDLEAPIPQTILYEPLRQFIKPGFPFSIRELLHAIGCKTASLPMSDTDECFQSAYVWVHVLDRTSNAIRILPSADSDLKTARSQELGIGMICLVAHRCWSFPWDQLGPIRGKGRRFDYRAELSGTRAIFEAKGTSTLRKQAGQIKSAIKKKDAHHKRGESYDIELALSTCLGTDSTEKRIRIADPEFEAPDSFGPEAQRYYRIRHYARVLQFAGITPLARDLRASWDLPFFFPGVRRRRDALRALESLEEVKIGDELYLGQTIDQATSSIANSNTPDPERPSRIQPGHLRIYQGLRAQELEAILSGNVDDIDVIGEPRRLKTEDGAVASRFPDGSLMVVRMGE